MDQKKRQGGQGNQGQEQGSQQPDQQSWNQSQNPNRDQAEGERNTSTSGGGISNRGMDSEEEQEDLPARGSERGSGQSER